MLYYSVGSCPTIVFSQTQGDAAERSNVEVVTSVVIFK